MRAASVCPCPRICLLLFLVVAHLSAGDKKPSTPATKPDNKEFELQIISGAAAIADQAEPASAAQLLLRAGAALNATDPSLALHYYRRAFIASESIPLVTPSNVRAGVQGGIAAGVAELDPKLAMALIRRADRPDWTAYPSEDFRLRPVHVLVQTLIARKTIVGVKQATELFSYLGQTGQYPYPAATEVISFFHDHHQDWRSNQIFTEALGYAREDSQFASTPDEFSKLIVSSSNIVSASLLASGIRVAIDAARRSDSKPKEDENSNSRTLILNADHGQVTIHRESTYIALRLLPLAMRVDAKLADELKRSDPDLRTVVDQSTGDLSSLSKAPAAVLMGEASPQAALGVGSEIRKYAAFRDNQQLAQSAPSKALQGIDEIDDPYLKAKALAGVAKAFETSDPNQAQSALIRSSDFADKIDDPSKKAEALVSAAEVWADLGNAAQVVSITDAAFSIARKVYDEAKTTRTDLPSFFRPGVQLLVAVAEQRARVDAAGSVQLSQSILEPEVRAYITLGVAKVLLSAANATRKSNSRENWRKN